MSKKSKIKRKKILNFFSKIKIKSLSFGFSDLTIIISLFLIIFSILTPWFSVTNKTAVEGIFSSIFGITGYLSIFLIFINLFIIFSNKTKQKIKLFFNNNLGDNQIFIFSSIIFFILGLNSYFIIKNGINLFTSEIKVHIGLTFYLIAIILYSTGIFFKLKQRNINNDFVSINESEEKNINGKSEKENTKNVMKLPFE